MVYTANSSLFFNHLYFILMYCFIFQISVYNIVIMLVGLVQDLQHFTDSFLDITIEKLIGKNTSRTKTAKKKRRWSLLSIIKSCFLNCGFSFSIQYLHT